LNGRRVSGRTPLAIGVPITIGGFELTLEDDFGSGDLDPLPPPALEAVTVAIPAAVVRKSERTAPAKAAPPRSATDRRQIVMWSSAAAVVVLIGVVTFAVVRSMTRPNKPGPPPVVENAPAAGTIDVPLPSEHPDDPKQQVEQQLADAHEQFEARKYDDAAQILARVLEMDPDNKDAEDLKRRIADATAPKPIGPAKPPTDADAPVATVGISVRAGESRTDYDARVKKIQTEMTDVEAHSKKQTTSRRSTGSTPLNATSRDTRASIRRSSRQRASRSRPFKTIFATGS